MAQKLSQPLSSSTPPPRNKQPLEAGRALEKEPGGQAVAASHLHTGEEQGWTGPTTKLPTPDSRPRTLGSRHSGAAPEARLDSGSSPGPKAY